MTASAHRAARLMLAAAIAVGLAASAAHGQAGRETTPGPWGGTLEVSPASPPRTGPARPPRGREAPGARPTAAAPRSPAGAQAAPTLATVLAAEVSGDDRRTRLAFDVAAPVAIEARSLADPSRVIVDLPEVEFRLPTGTGQSAGGLISRYRFGLIEAGRSRIVLDTMGTVRIVRAEVVGPLSTGRFRLEIDLAPATAADVAAWQLAEAAARSVAAEPVPATPAMGIPQGRAGRRPVVVVDAGHGGIDPGAEGAAAIEKHIVLDVARHVERVLSATRRYEVVMTRTTDVFVSLDERLRISQAHHADLFLSLHADSLPSKELARSVRGATVYTLAEQASDDLARRMAEKENAVDLLAGLPLTGSGDDQVRAILIDLLRRESATYSQDFRRHLLAELRPRIAVAREPARSGPFKVLRQAGSPAVLIELGYMSNADDERLMATSAWQGKVAQAIAAAVDAHFHTRTAGKR
ncbi:MAG: N-acetylmuramoyl-L-alanine amidase [Hyphomicrobiaceae bacterium]|nr:N-acetylmuramoyl-L-alanine amidase [Hyphomicrobiaceae bacterium]